MLYNKETVGNKAYNLYKLAENGINVPKFFVSVNAEFDFYDELEDGKYYAVRSSAVNEDNENASFAGQLESFLYVKKDEVYSKIQTVIESAHSKRIEFYKKHNDIDIENSDVCVIVQEMVNSDTAGVAFSSNPVTGARKSVLISSVFGQGEGLVSGDFDSDTYIVKDNTIEKNIANKPYKLVFNEETQSGTKKVENPKANESSLSDNQVTEIYNTINKIVEIYSKPQDIEWAYENGKLYILQSRPVTTLNKIPDTEDVEVLWDNSNITESYSGVTSPLTFSFIKDVYTEVYKQFLMVMGVERELIDVNENIFQMLGLINGRVYYNLLNWYKLLKLMPGYEVNASFMESMMGVKKKLNQPVKVIPSKKNKYLRLAIMLINLFTNLVKLPKNIDKFYVYIDETLSKYEKNDLKRLKCTELKEIFKELETKLLKNWQAPLVNDFYAMIFYGILKKMLLKVDNSGTLQNDLLTGETGIISTVPVKMVKQISNLICQNEEANKLFLNNSQDVIEKELINFPEINNKINEFINKFGNRCIGELKLETITYKQDKKLLLYIIKSYVKQGLYDIEKDKLKEIEIRKEAEKIAFSKIKNPLFGTILKNARLRVKNRENMRFERTRLFGLVREIFLAIGFNFEYDNIIENKRDIFYLTKDEIFNYITGCSADVELKKIIELRKIKYKTYEDNCPSDRFSTFGIVYNANSYKNEEDSVEEVSDLKGIGCCKGIVRAKVKVVRDVSESQGLEGCIMVAQRTDPGWVPLFPISKGILVERGSILSHSAIVAREMGIPAIVGINNLLNILKDGDLVEMNGAEGTVRIIKDE